MPLMAHKIIARWVMMTVSVMEQADRRTAVIPQTDRTAIMKNDLPARWLIVTANYTGRELGSLFWHSAAQIVNEERTNRRGLTGSTTFAVGQTHACHHRYLVGRGLVGIGVVGKGIHGEAGDLAGPGLGVQSLDVPTLADSDGGVAVDLDEIAPGRLACVA